MSISKIFFLALLVNAMLLSCNPPTDVSENVGPVDGFNEALAKSYGADQYGMKQYVMAFLKKGPNRSEDPDKVAALQKAHQENIGKLAEEGKLVLAGPFLDNAELRGIYIFNTSDPEEAKAWTETDPAIKEQSLIMELKPWYGSAALMGINDTHKTLSKEEI